MTGTAITISAGGACLKNTTAKELGPIASYDADYPDEWTPGHQPLVLLCNREVTGTIRIDFKPARRVVFRLIAIDTPRQGQGLGSFMLEMAEDYARARGVELDLPELGARCLWLLCPPRVQTMALGRLHQQPNRDTGDEAVAAHPWHGARPIS